MSRLLILLAFIGSIAVVNCKITTLTVAAEYGQLELDPVIASYNFKAIPLSEGIVVNETQDSFAVVAPASASMKAMVHYPDVTAVLASGDASALWTTNRQVVGVDQEDFGAHVSGTSAGLSVTNVIGKVILLNQTGQGSLLAIGSMVVTKHAEVIITGQYTQNSIFLDKFKGTVKVFISGQAAQLVVKNCAGKIEGSSSGLYAKVLYSDEGCKCNVLDRFKKNICNKIDVETYTNLKFAAKAAIVGFNEVEI